MVYYLSTPRLQKNDGQHNEKQHHHDVVPKVYKPGKHFTVFF